MRGFVKRVQCLNRKGSSGMNNGLDISVGFGRLHLKIPVILNDKIETERVC